MRDKIAALVVRFAKEPVANVAVIFALAMLPVMAVTGMSIDYTIATRRQAQLTGIADAAALLTTTPIGMSVSAAVAQANATAMFNAQAAAVSGVGAVNVTVTVTDTTPATSTKTRTTTVSYNASSSNAFAGILQMASMPIGGTSKANNSVAANIDFYLLLDTSPSMAIPSTTAGINQMVAATPKQSGGCAFACHQTNTNTADTAGNPPGMDNYALAKQLGIELRIDEVKSAAANLFTTAAAMELQNGAVYRAATYTFDETFANPTPLTANLALAAQQALTNVNLQEVTQNNLDLAGKNNSDMDTQFDQAMAYSQYLPAAGNGSNNSGDTPKEVLFLVTDGVFDEPYPGVGSTNYMLSGGRTIGPMNYQNDWCTPLKKQKNIEIAVLYTTYNPLPNNSFYMSHVQSFQSSIASYLNSCATPGLFFQVNTDGDINGAMQALFARAVTTAYLSR